MMVELNLLKNGFMKNSYSRTMHTTKRSHSHKYALLVVVWHGGNSIECIREVTVRPTQLVMGCVTAYEWENHIGM